MVGVRGSAKGQVTIFIIIGILIVFGFSAVLFVTQNTVSQKTTADGIPVIKQVPVQFEPINTFTENCLSSIGKEALILIGDQGGYIHPDLVGKYSSSNPTETDGLEINSLNIPYWHYNKAPNSDNKISFASLQPPLASTSSELSIQSQLERYSEEHLPACLRNYAHFAEQGFKITSEEPEVTVIVRDNTVGFWLQMEVDAKLGDAKTTIEQFYTPLPLNFKRYYDLAAAIAQGQRDLTFIERQGMDLISVYSGVDPEKLPPLSNIRFETVPEASWTKQDVKNKLRSVLTSNVPLLRDVGSSNFYRKKYPVTDLSNVIQQNYDNSLLEFPNTGGVEISFDYLNWPIYFDSNSGSRIAPSHYSVNYNILHMSIQQYYNVYDVSYPVLVTLHDPTAFNGEGYSFVFALEANIRDNAPAEPDAVLTPTISFEDSLACDPSNFDTALLKTVVVDGSTGEPLENVRIGFTIPEQDECTIGSTNSLGELESKYPAAYGGVMNFVKTDYLTNFYPITTYGKKEPSILGYAIADLTPSVDHKVVKMYPKKKIKADVKAKIAEKCIDTVCYGFSPFGVKGNTIIEQTPILLDEPHKWVFTGTNRALKETEQATVILERVADLSNFVANEEFVQVIATEGTQVADIELFPGVYKVTGTVALNDELTIPAEERCLTSPEKIAETCLRAPITSPYTTLVDTIEIVEGFTDTELVEELPEVESCSDNLIKLIGECQQFDAIQMDGFLSGLVEWNTPTSYLTITPEQLYGSDIIEIYLPVIDIENVPEEEHVRVSEDIQVSSLLGEISRHPDIRPQLEPTLK